MKVQKIVACLGGLIAGALIGSAIVVVGCSSQSSGGGLGGSGVGGSGVGGSGGTGGSGGISAPLMLPPNATVTCGGVDDTATLQTALDGRKVVLFTGRCKVTTLTIRPTTYLYGLGTGSDCTTAPSAIEGTPGNDVIHFEDQGWAEVNQAVYMGGFNLCAGENGITTTNATTSVTLEDLVVQQMAGDGISIKGGVEWWSLRGVLLKENNVGFHAYNDKGTRQDQSRMDKMFLNMTLDGNVVGAILGAGFQNSLTLDSVVAQNNISDGIQITGESRGVVFINFTGSSNGGCDLTIPIGLYKQGIMLSGGALYSACSIDGSGVSDQAILSQTFTAGSVVGTVRQIALPLVLPQPAISRTGSKLVEVVCGGVDDTNELQAAIDSAQPVYFTGLCVVRTLVLHSGTTLLGGGINTNACDQAPSVLHGTSGYDLLKIEDQGATETTHINLYNFNTCYGDNAIVSNGRSTNINIDRVVFALAGQDAARILGSAEGWILREVQAIGQPVGIHAYADAGSAGESKFANSSLQLRTDFNNQGVILASSSMSSLVFPGFQNHIGSSAQHEAMVISGPVSDLIIVAAYTEDNNTADHGVFSDFVFSGPANQDAYFYGGNIAIGTQWEQYSIDAAGATSVTVAAVIPWRPINDPGGIVTQY
jgi:hypothetical protein